jgi:L-cysteine/cystine lyase
VDAAGLRREFPVLRKLTYLNAGTDGPVPARAVTAAEAELWRAAQDGRARKHFARRAELRDAQREAYAALLACAPTDVALTTSTSEGVATAVAGLGLGRGDEIVTSDEEHPGLIGPLLAAREVNGAAIRVVPLTEVAQAVGPQTRLVACCHVGWVGGALAPAELAQVDVPVLLDGAQGIGAVPVDVGALGCDIYAGAGQKWLCGPDGTGMLYVSGALRERVAVTAPSYMSFVDANLGFDAELHTDARRYDTPSLPAEAGAFAMAAHDLFAEHGWDDVLARARSLAARLAQMLTDRGEDVAPRGDTTLVSWRREDAEAVRDGLGEQGIVIRDLPGRGLLRASVGAWNDEQDLQRLVDAIG